MKKTLLISTAFFLSAASFAQTKVTNSEAVKGQTNIEHNKAGTQVNSSENASSATTIHTSIVENAKNGSTDQIKEDNKAMAAEKQALAAQANDKGQATAAAAKAKASSTLEDNNADENSSLSGKGNVSSTDKNQFGKLTSTEHQSIHATLKGDNRSQVAVDKTAAKAQDKIDAASKVDDNSSVSGDETVSGSADNNEVGKLKSTEKENVHATLKGDNRSQVAVDKTAAAAQHKIDATSAATVHTAAANVHAVHVKPVSVKAGAHVRTAAGIRIR